MAETTEGTELAVPGVIYVGKHGGNAGRSLVRLGPAAGWIAPRGIRHWEREISVVAREALTPDIKKDLGIAMPEEQIPAAKMPITAQAAKASPLVGVARSLVDKLVAKGVRVHTVGFDRISGGFYYFAEGGGGESLRIQQDLMEMLAAALGDAADNAALEKNLDEVIDRLLVELSKGAVNEASVELAEALPRAAADGTGLEDVDLEAFEKEASQLVGRSERWQQGAKKLAEKLGATKDAEVVKVPLFGEARREAQKALDVQVGGATRKLAARGMWSVSGPPREIKEEAAQTSPKPAAATAAATKKAEPAPTAKKAEVSPAPAAAAKKAEPAKETKKETPAAKVEAKPAETKPAEAKKEQPKAEAKTEEKKPAAEAKKETAKEEKKPAAEKETKAEGKKAEEKKAEKGEKPAKAEKAEKAEKKAKAEARAEKASDETKKAAAESEVAAPASSYRTIGIVIALIVAAYIVWRVMHPQ